MRAPLMLVATSCLVGCSQVEFELPPNYVGWVRVELQDARCAPMSRVGLKRLVKVGNDGRACTSEGMPSGWRHDTYVRSNPERSTIDSATLVWSQAVGEDFRDGRSIARHYSFFVGSSEQMHGSGLGPPTWGVTSERPEPHHGR